MAWMYPDPKKTTSDDLDHALLQWSLCPFKRKVWFLLKREDIITSLVAKKKRKKTTTRHQIAMTT